MAHASRNSIRDIWGKRTSYESEWPVRVDKQLADEPDKWVQSCCVMTSAHVERSRVADDLGLLRDSHIEFAEACRGVMATHVEESEIQDGLTRLKEFSEEAVGCLRPHIAHYEEHEAEQPHKLRETLFPTARPGAFGLLRDLQNLVLLATESEGAVTSLTKAAHELGDAALCSTCGHVKEQTKRQLAWLLTQVKHRSAHTLVVPQG